MKRTDRKSACPINFSLEAIGDAWSLLIVRDIALGNKHTYKDFLNGDERITTSVLADRLAHLENHGIIAKQPYPGDKRRDKYVLTERGLGLIPILLDMMEWGTTNEPTTTGPWTNDFIERIRAERSPLAQETIAKARHEEPIF